MVLWNSLYLSFTVKTQSWLLMTLRKKLMENIVGKEENAGNQRFPWNIFNPSSQKILIPDAHSICHLQNAFSLDKSEILLKG